MIEKLIKIQQELKVPKNQRNTFGNYNFRSCEDIVEEVKPLCHAEGFSLILSDEVIEVGGRVYVKATAKLFGIEPEHFSSVEAAKGNKVTVPSKEFTMESHGWAREAEVQKGMNDSQITGSASSYARKYALNGLFAIDDTKDADATNTHDKEKSVTPAKKDEADLDF